LSTNAAGQVVYELKHPFRNGTTHILFSPQDFLARLAALVPRPRSNLTRYHGVFALNSRFRKAVVPGSFTWAQRLKRVFEIDITLCPYWGGTLRVIADVTYPQVIQTILAHLQHQQQRAPPPLLPRKPARAPPVEPHNRQISLLRPKTASGRFGPA